VLQTFIGYLGYVVFLFLFTGVMLIFFESKSYKKEKLYKEEKVTKIIGWCNLSIGICIFLGNWVYNQFLI
jgi:hypothetical protein